MGERSVVSLVDDPDMLRSIQPTAERSSAADSVAAPRSGQVADGSMGCVVTGLMIAYLYQVRKFTPFDELEGVADYFLIELTIGRAFQYGTFLTLNLTRAGSSADVAQSAGAAIWDVLPFVGIDYVMRRSIAVHFAVHPAHYYGHSHTPMF